MSRKFLCPVFMTSTQETQLLGEKNSREIGILDNLDIPERNSESDLGLV